MQSVTRQFGKLRSRGPGENARVSALLNDYEDVDRVLAKIIEDSKSLRDAWLAMATTQFGVVKEYVGLYDPIVGAHDGHGRPSIQTPELQLHRTFKLRETYAVLKDDLVEEISVIDARVIQPATTARDYIQPIRRTIKKRENKRLDFEKVQDKVTKLQRKGGKSAKEEAQLAKAEVEMNALEEEFKIADAHLRDTLPPIIAATFSILPPLVVANAQVQNRLLGLYYTALHNYCNENDFPSPPPPMDHVIATWAAAFKPAQREFEGLPCIANGKAIRMPMSMADDGQARKPSTSAASSYRNGTGRSTSGLTSSASRDGSTSPVPPRPMRIPSANSLPLLSPTATNPSPQPSPRSSSVNVSGLLRPTDFTTASTLGGSSPVSPQIRSDYFTSQESAALATSAASALAKKKKPPPPPPPKRPSVASEEFVVAQFDFAGQGRGDLSFREGDRIKIIKKTQTDQDWWVGELAGRQGSFPANYCKAS